MDELVATEARIRKQRQETMYAQRERRRKFVEIVAWVVMIGAGSAVPTTFVLLLKAHTAQAKDWANDLDDVPAGQRIKLDNKQEVCVYRGATIPRKPCSSIAANETAEYLCQCRRTNPRRPTSMTF